VKAVLCGNIFGTGLDEVTLTEASLKSQADQVLVAEVSSFQLEWVRFFHPAVAGITNITPDHMDRYDSFEEYVATKQRLFGRQIIDDIAVVNADDPMTEPHRRGPSVLTYGPHGSHAFAVGGYFTVGDRSIRISELPFSAPHEITDALMASQMACGVLRKRTGIRGRARFSPPKEVFEGLKRFKGLAHRMEEVGTGRGVRFINNSMCTNPAAVVASVLSVAGPMHLLMGGVSKDLDFRPVREMLEWRPLEVYLFGRDARTIRETLGKGAVFATMQEAFGAAVQKVQDGDTVMLAPGCASMDQFGDFRERGDVFKTIAKEWLSHGSEG